MFHSHDSSEFKEYPTISLPELSGIIGRETSREVILIGNQNEVYFTFSVYSNFHLKQVFKPIVVRR